MDNLTHSLAAMTVAEVAVGMAPKARRSTLRPVLWLTSVVANNLPDLDFLYAGITEGKVGYLLHHRGHTHTLVAAVPAVLLSTVLGLVFARVTKRRLLPREVFSLAALALVGHLLHIAMDGMNSYGIHPFWPWRLTWMYGDFLFIIEPALWAGAVPPLLFVAKGRLARVLLGIPLFGGLVLLWAFPLVPWYAALLVSLWAALVWFLMAGLDPSHRAPAGIVAMLVVAGGFAAISHHNRETVVLRHDSKEGFRLTDVILSPLPSNPFCWSLITVETDDRTYRMRKALFASFPRIVPARKCPIFRTGQGAAPLAPVALPQSADLWWLGELEGDVVRLRELSTRHCGIAAALKFIRAPFLLDTPRDYVVGDLRFDFRRGPGFAQMLFPKHMSHCPEHVPPWDEPARKLLERN